MAEKIALGADHGGFALKEKIKKELGRKGYTVFDAGTYSEEPCDYPRFCFNAAAEVARKKAIGAIVICKSGIGMSIVANKLPGVRAALCLNEEDAKSARQHNHANVLALSGNKISASRALRIIDVWLGTKPLKGRHARRVRQVKAIEEKVFRQRLNLSA